MSNFSFNEVLLSKNNNKDYICSASSVMSHLDVPKVLQNPIESSELKEWFMAESKKRLATIDKSQPKENIQAGLEMPNRYLNGSMTPVSLNDLIQMSDLCASVTDILNRAKLGTELLKNNKQHSDYGTAARGVPGGGASSRAAKWTRLNPEVAYRFGLTENTPRPLFYAGSKTLLQHTIDFSGCIARNLGKVFPNIVMTNSENVQDVLKTVRSDWHHHTKNEREATIFFNQIVLPRMWVNDETLVENKLFPAGHGDYPYLLAKYKIASTLNELGIKYLVFSNADEWLWQADPVMVSIADELFKKGHHMVIIGTKNTNNQFGGGFVRLSDGTQSLVETPRLPWEIVEKGIAPVALNTTFYMIDVAYLAAHEKSLMEVEKSLVIKEVPGRKEGEVEQIIGVDSWAGDVFAACLNPAFIEWPRLNFLGIKDGSFITGNTPQESLGGRTYLHYISETIATYPVIMQKLIAGDEKIAKLLFNQKYSYLPTR